MVEGWSKDGKGGPKDGRGISMLGGWVDSILGRTEVLMKKDQEPKEEEWKKEARKEEKKS